MGAILCPVERTVTAVLRVVGLSKEKHFQNYHRVLNRAIWSSLEASHILLGLLINAFAMSGPVILGLDDTIERRRGAKIKAKGIYRDPVRSSHNHLVKASGLRWLSLMLLAPIPWAYQMILQTRLWLSKRLLVVVAGSSFAAIELLWQLRQPNSSPIGPSSRDWTNAGKTMVQGRKRNGSLIVPLIAAAA